MSAAEWLQIATLIVAIVLVTRFLGAYLAKVYGGGTAPGDKVFGPIERGIYRVAGVDPRREQRWTVYALSLLAFSAVSVVVLYALLRLQGVLPGNPNGFGAVAPALSFNTAVSFVTNTNWQSYSGESTMSFFTQMAGLAVQNFVSAAVGIAVAVALIRGLVRRRSATIGNFWVDLTRTVIRVLLPISIVFGLFFVSQGMVQNFHGDRTVATVDGGSQTITGGPVASQEVIKEFGTNGGGFYNANSAHPFENPNPLTDWVEILLLLSIPFALTYTFGRLVGDQRQGWVVFAAMFVLWAASVAVATGFEVHGNPLLDKPGVTQTATSQQAGGNLEGKEVRFGPAASGLFAGSTTGTSTGAVNSFHDSYTPAGGAAPLANMMLGEVSPGGTGSGLYGMLVFALLSVFIAGLMVGRTPEYLGKKIQALGDEARRAVPDRRPTRCARVQRGVGAAGHGEVIDPQPRPARPHRGHLRVHLRREQQRLCVRRPDDQHRLVQHHAGPRDAGRSLPADRARARDRGSARPEAADTGDRRNVPDGDAPLCRAARRRRAHRRGVDLLPRLGPRAHRRTAGDLT